MVEVKNRAYDHNCVLIYAQAGHELEFEGINHSSRHKSAITVHFRRMLRIRTDKQLHQANTLNDLKVLLI